MLRKFPLVVIASLCAEAAAQSASYNTPITQASVASVIVDTFSFSRNTSSVNIGVVYRDASLNPLNGTGLTPAFAIPSTTGQAGAVCTTTLNGLAGAMNTARSGETGGNARIQQFRILGYLSDQSCLTGVTLVP